MKSILLRSSPSPALFQAKDVRRSVLSAPSRSNTVRCSSRRGENPILEPFSRSLIDRISPDLPLIYKAKQDLANHCTKFEGDDSYYCWMARFDFDDLEKLVPEKELERMICREGEDPESLMKWVPKYTAAYKKYEENALVKEKLESTENENENENENEEAKEPPHIPEWLPKSEQELEEEEKFKMEDSPFTTLLRYIGRKDTSMDYKFIWD